MSSIYIFNQYYIDLIKKLKVIAKKHKDTSNTAKKVLNSIKENYSTLDKSSDEYVSFINSNINTDIWDSYVNLEADKTDDWLEANSQLVFFKDIVLEDIVKLLRDNFLCHHYISVFYIFKDTFTEDQSELIEKIVKILQTLDTTTIINDLENEKYKTILLRLNSIKVDNIKTKTGIDMEGLKDTTIGKIAKEIIDDVDVSRLQKSLNEEGDIFKAIAKPDSGFSELFTNVSQKMASKISSGELSQENIIKDAVKFAGVIPGLFNNAGGGGNSGAKGGNDFKGMMNMMSMMSSMMKGSGGDDDDNGDMDMANLFKSMASSGMGGGNKKSKMSVNNQGLKKVAKMKQMRAKLAKNKASKESTKEEDN